jgi:hypothetical protein
MFGQMIAPSALMMLLVPGWLFKFRERYVNGMFMALG